MEVCQQGRLEITYLSQPAHIFVFYGFTVEGSGDFRELENNVCSDFSFLFFQKELRQCCRGIIHICNCRKNVFLLHRLYCFTGFGKSNMGRLDQLRNWLSLAVEIGGRN